MRITDAITDTFDRIRPGPRVPAARRRAAKSAALNGTAPRIDRSKLQEQRDELAREFVGLQWDLGGVAYEMAIRDYFRLDVLTKQAAKLQQVDSALGQAERMLRLEQEGIAGTCPSCGGVQARGAVFCWQCGEQLTPTATNGVGVATTAVASPPADPPVRPPDTQSEVSTSEIAIGMPSPGPHPSDQPSSHELAIEEGER